MSEIKQPASALSSPRFCNMGTFMRMQKVDTAEGLDFAIAGAPFDTGSSFRSGSRFGPNAIRNISAMMKPNNVIMQVNIMESLKGGDIGDFNITPGYIHPSYDAIEKGVAGILEKNANIDRLVGGAGEATIIARVGEGIVTTVGSSEKHTDVLENPDHISRTVLGKGLDSGTAFEILSIDIADVDVGRNIGAQLQTDQAEADKQIAQARAEERRAMAVAKEQEMRAYTQEMQAKVVEAQAKVPLALADALRAGNLGVMDYYNMKNIVADTEMRENIAGSSEKKN